MMFRRKQRATKNQSRIAELESEVDALKRTLAVRDVEIQQLAALTARDRARVEAESAAFVRQRAEYEAKHGRAI